MKAGTNVEHKARVVRHGALIISSLFLVLAALILAGCGKQETSASSTSATEAVAQQSPDASSSAGTDTNPAPTSEKPAPQDDSTLSAKGQGRLDEFMAKVDEQLSLDDAQREQVQSAVRNFLINMETKVQQGQGIAQSGQGRQGSGRPDLTDQQREELAQMKQMGGPGQVTQQLQEVLTTDQMGIFQQLMEKLRQEMILQRTIDQMGGTPPTDSDQE